MYIWIVVDMKKSAKQPKFIGLIILIICMLTGLSLKAIPVGTFVLVSKGSVADITPYENAILKANLENFRYRNNRALITFNNGVQFELLSANELVAAGHYINIANYKTGDDPAYIAPVFQLASNGFLIAGYTKSSAKTKSILNAD